MCDTDEELRVSVSKIKEAYDEYKSLVHLQTEFIQDYKQLENNMVMVQYSDGTQITIDYKNAKYEVRKTQELGSVAMVKKDNIFQNAFKLIDCNVVWNSGIAPGANSAKQSVGCGLFYVFRGSCDLFVDDILTTVSEGKLILYRPGSRFEYPASKQTDLIYCYVFFEGDKCEKMLLEIFSPESGEVYIGIDKHIKAVFEKIAAELSFKRPCFEEISYAYMLELFALLKRNQLCGANTRSATYSDMVDSVCKLMLSECHKHTTLKYYADFCNLSVSRFSKVFKKETDVAPSEYLITARIEKAKQLLAETGLSVLEVAEKTGFYDQSYFGRVFKKYTGISPGKFRSYL